MLKLDEQARNGQAKGKLCGRDDIKRTLCLSDHLVNRKRHLGRSLYLSVNRIFQNKMVEYGLWLEINCMCLKGKQPLIRNN